MPCRLAADSFFLYRVIYWLGSLPCHEPVAEETSLFFLTRSSRIVPLWELCE